MIDVLDRQSLAFNLSNVDDGLSIKDNIMNLTRDKLFFAHRTIPQDKTNHSLFLLEFPDILESLLKGISHAFLAVGAKDSGKTHSLFGTLSDPGIILYFAKSLFTRK